MTTASTKSPALSPLTPRFGVEVKGIDLSAVASQGGAAFAQIRDLFERHSLLLFRGQVMDDAAHLKLAALFGPIEVRSKEKPLPPPSVSRVTNVKADGSLMTVGSKELNHNRANGLWHTDSTFLPVPALVNILRAEVVPSQGGETEFASTRAAFADMPPAMKEKLRGAVFQHRYAHSRAKIDKELAKDALFTMWQETEWRALWRNPVTGEDAVYIASHVYGVKGWPQKEAEAFIEEVTAFCTQPQYFYSHKWQVGDVLLWDERATLHRGQPWPFDEPRTLASVCSSVTPSDGLAAVTP